MAADIEHKKSKNLAQELMNIENEKRIKALEEERSVLEQKLMKL